MAALTAEVIQLLSASISASASVEVMLSLADHQTVAEGLLGTLPSPPARIFYRDHTERKAKVCHLYGRNSSTIGIASNAPLVYENGEKKGGEATYY